MMNRQFKNTGIGASKMLNKLEQKTSQSNSNDTVSNRKYGIIKIEDKKPKVDNKKQDEFVIDDNMSYEAYKERLNRLSPGLGIETPDYNLKGAYEAKMIPQMSSDGKYHLGSRNPNTGEILKKPGHPTWDLMLEGEKEAGYEVYEKDGKWFSKKIEEKQENIKQ